MAGDIEALALRAGRGMDLVRHGQPAADIVREVAGEARGAVRKPAA